MLLDDNGEDRDEDGVVEDGDDWTDVTGAGDDNCDDMTFTLSGNRCVAFAVCGSDKDREKRKKRNIE